MNLALARATTISQASARLTPAPAAIPPTAHRVGILSQYEPGDSVAAFEVNRFKLHQVSLIWADRAKGVALGSAASRSTAVR
jgi:hypothetical protein